MSAMVFSQPQIGIEFQHFQNVSLLSAQSKSRLIRSTGSFSVVEENIVAPTPRKIPSVVSSPVVTRVTTRRKSSIRPEESLFGEAVAELQTILFLSPPTTPKSSPHSNDEVFSSEEEVLSMMMNRCQSPCIASPPPLRAPNPLALNSPFQGTLDAGSVIESETKKDAQLATTKAVPAPQLGKSSSKLGKTRFSRNPRASKPLREKNELNIAQAGSANRKLDNGRMRSKSWPVLPTVMS